MDCYVLCIHSIKHTKQILFLSHRKQKNGKKICFSTFRFVHWQKGLVGENIIDGDIGYVVWECVCAMCIEYSVFVALRQIFLFDSFRWFFYVAFFRFDSSNVLYLFHVRHLLSLQFFFSVENHALILAKCNIKIVFNT